ncbi:MAG: RNA polymerase sigma factor [Acidobacteria bacterium]|nr:RNA polymerase sigma factor [Acidobacteriota bacterium]MBV9146260.1 RNA polymerase sigma factor [Acidobacteriota bacterium]MBV9438070.1 RNA polymerase sigma factor [Acidobacteriota bacterium]
MELTDRAAVDEVLAGKHESFRVLVDRHGRKVFGLAYRMTGNEQDADEVVQETFLRSFKRLSSFESRSSFSTWLYRIASNCALDLLAKRKQDKLHLVENERPEEDGNREERALEYAAPDPDPERMLLSSELRDRVAKAMQRLTAVERTAFVLRHFEGQSISEIGAVLKVKDEAVKNTIFRAVKKMRGELEPFTAAGALKGGLR